MNADAVGFLALLVVAGAGVVWFRRAVAVRLPQNRIGFLAVWLCGGALGIAALAGGAGWIGGVPAVLAVIGTTFFVFTVAISRQQVAADAITVGAMLPDFSAVDEDGVTFEAASLAGHPVLLKFFRGHW